MVMYDNELKTKENKTKDRIKPVDNIQFCIFLYFL